MTLLDKLTPHQRQVIELVLEDKSDKEIGLILGLSPRTVEAHKSNARGRLGIPRTYRNTAEALRSMLKQDDPMQVTIPLNTYLEAIRALGFAQGALEAVCWSLEGNSSPQDIAHIVEASKVAAEKTKEVADRLATFSNECGNHQSGNPGPQYEPA